MSEISEVEVRATEAPFGMWQFDVSSLDGKELLRWYCSEAAMLHGGLDLPAMVGRRLGGEWVAPAPASRGAIRLVRS